MTSPADIVMAEVHPQQTQTNPGVQSNDRLTFPRDFPPVPEGVTIIPFKEFKERGIRVEAGPDEAEIDTLGIPTVPMKKHNTDYCKTNTSRKRLKERNRQKRTDGKPLPWWEQWEGDESTRLAKPTNASDSRISKFLAAAADFKIGRKWPAGIAQQTDPTYIWNKIEVFLGIVGAKAASKAASKKKVFKTTSDDEADMSDIDGDDGEGNGTDEEFSNVMGKEKKVVNFINDPEKIVKIFLSSYARAKGLIWSNINLEQTPRLWKFFLQFLLRSRVLPRCEDGLRLALEATEKAMIELPKAGNLSSIIPDRFNQACVQCWGAKTETFQTLHLDEDFLAGLQSKPPPEELLPAKDSELVEPTPEGWTAAGWEADGGGGTGWGDASRAWPGAEENNDPEDAENNPWLEKPEAKPSLMMFMGPTTLPLTHTTGIVEKSLRRIKTLIPIPTGLPPKAAINDEQTFALDPAVVETELEWTFPKVVLTPWLDWDGGQMPVYSAPTILETSQGPVVDPPYVLREESAEKPVVNGQKLHDPASDDITILVHPSTFDELLEGMSIAATWVQIVRVKVDSGEPPVPKKRKKGKKKPAANFWYIDDLGGIFPSFWTVPTA